MNIKHLAIPNGYSKSHILSLQRPYGYGYGVVVAITIVVYVWSSFIGGILIHLHGTYCGVDPLKPREWLTSIAIMNSDGCKSLNYMGQVMLRNRIMW